MTEHKFGTWYPIEELDRKWQDVDVLLYNGSVAVGNKSWDSDGDVDGYFCYNGFLTPDPVSWMPLPPRPGEGE